MERRQPACTWQRKQEGAGGTRVQGGDVDGTSAVAGNKEDTASTGTTLIRCRGCMDGQEVEQRGMGLGRLWLQMVQT